MCDAIVYQGHPYRYDTGPAGHGKQLELEGYPVALKQHWLLTYRQSFNLLLNTRSKLC